MKVKNLLKQIGEPNLFWNYQLKMKFSMRKIEAVEFRNKKQSKIKKT